MFRVDVEILCGDLFDKLDEVKVEFLDVKMLDVAIHTLCDTMADNFAKAEVEILHGTKNWIYCTFDTRQKLSQIWYWL